MHAVHVIFASSGTFFRIRLEDCLEVFIFWLNAFTFGQGVLALSAWNTGANLVSPCELVLLRGIVTWASQAVLWSGSRVSAKHHPFQLYASGTLNMTLIVASLSSKPWLALAAHTTFLIAAESFVASCRACFCAAGGVEARFALLCALTTDIALAILAATRTLSTDAVSFRIAAGKMLGIAIHWKTVFTVAAKFLRTELWALLRAAWTPEARDTTFGAVACQNGALTMQATAAASLSAVWLEEASRALFAITCVASAAWPSISDVTAVAVSWAWLFARCSIEVALARLCARACLNWLSFAVKAIFHHTYWACIWTSLLASFSIESSFALVAATIAHASSLN